MSADGILRDIPVIQGYMDFPYMITHMMTNARARTDAFAKQIPWIVDHITIDDVGEHAYWLSFCNSHDSQAYRIMFYME